MFGKQFTNKNTVVLYLKYKTNIRVNYVKEAFNPNFIKW